MLWHSYKPFMMLVTNKSVYVFSFTVYAVVDGVGPVHASPQELALLAGVLGVTGPQEVQ